jgi:hypothetical protein
MQVVKTLDHHFLQSKVGEREMGAIVGVFVKGLERKYEEGKGKSVDRDMSGEEIDCLVEILFA